MGKYVRVFGESANGRASELALPFDAVKPEDERLTLVGDGRSAIVFLGFLVEPDTEDANVETQGEAVAVKMLRDDSNSEYAASLLRRFRVEVLQAQRCGNREQATFVGFRCHGALAAADTSENQLPAGSSKNADNPVLKRLCQHYQLQGPFYAMEMCFGTLFDVLERDGDWQKMGFFQGSPKRLADLGHAKSQAAADIKKVKRAYIPQSRTLRGYDILNAFATDAPSARQLRLRSIAELALSIAEVVGSLHKENFVHRDLKPGNILLWQRPGAAALRFELRLADLGYVASTEDLVEGRSLPEWRTPGMHTPGSQYYRAPEQWTLPIEVRLDTRPEDSAVVIRGSKVQAVDVGDVVAIADARDARGTGSERGKREIFRVNAVPGSDKAEEIVLHLDRTLTSDRSTDLGAHVIKATGYHTDGFSVGSILYDLASGGKDPERFYLYCLLRYQGEPDASSRSIDSVIKELKKSRPKLGSLMDSVGAGGSRRTKGLAKHVEYQLDKNDQWIPDSVLRIIVRCMLRNFVDSYYRSVESQGFHTEENRTKMSVEVTADLRRLLESEECASPSAFPISLSQSSLVLNLRCLADDTFVVAEERDTPTEPLDPASFA